MRFAWLVFVVAAVAVGGCKREEPRVTLAPIAPYFVKTFQPRLHAAAQRDDVSAAVDRFGAAVTGDPALAASLEALLGALTGDAGVVAATGAIQDAIQAEPRVQARIAALMDAHPEWEPVQIGEAFGAEFGAVYERTLAPPIVAAGSRLIASADVNAEALWLPYTDMLEGAMERYLNAHGRAWSVRLTALNGGERPGPQRATELYVDHAWSEERIAMFIIALCDDPVTRRETIAALRAIAGSAKLRQAVVAALRTVVVDPGVQRAVVELFASAFDPAGAAPIEAQVQALFEMPALRAGVAGFLRAVVDDPATKPAIMQGLRAMGADPGTRARLDAVLDGW